MTPAAGMSFDDALKEGPEEIKTVGLFCGHEVNLRALEALAGAHQFYLFFFGQADLFIC